MESKYVISAMEEALKSDCRCKHGAIIVKNGKIIARGHNKERGYDEHGATFPNKKITRHAEQNALLSCQDKKELRDADMYVVRVKMIAISKNAKNDNKIREELSNSEPCSTCKQILINCM